MVITQLLHGYYLPNIFWVVLGQFLLGSVKVASFGQGCLKLASI